MTEKNPLVHVLLTFDVEEAEYGGMLDEKTERVVKVLKEHSLPATFFLDGATTLTYPRSVRLLAENGYELALHSDYHPVVGWRHHRDYDFGIQNSEKQISRIQNAISMIRGVIPDFNPQGFRAPTFSWNEDLYFSLNKLGFLYDSSRKARRGSKCIFQPFLQGQVVVFPVNCGEQDDACYGFSPSYVVDTWMNSFHMACQAAAEDGESHFVLIMHPCCIGKRGNPAMLKAMLKGIDRYRQYVQVKFETCSEAAARILGV